MRRITLNTILEGRHPRYGRASLWVQQGILIAAVVLFSLSTIPGPVPGWLWFGNLLIVSIFALEYGGRLWSAPDRRAYVFSFWGVVDLVAFLPSLLLLPVDGQAVRALRLLQLLRLLKFVRYNHAISRLRLAFRSVREELIVALGTTMIVLYLSAVGIWIFEAEAQPESFGSVFHCLWWAVATLTTVGYGDVYPITAGGRVFTGLILIIGLAIVAVPTGLITSALTRENIEKMEDESNDPR